MELGQRLSKDDIVTWQRILNKKGWAVPSWPVEWGGTDWGAVKTYIFKEEMQLAPAPDPLSFNVSMIGPVLCEFGTEEQKRALPAEGRQPRLLVLPGILRARRRLRSRLAADLGAARRRSLRRQRPEDLDLARAARRLDVLPRAHRRRRQAPARHLLPADRHEDAGLDACARSSRSTASIISTRCSSTTCACRPDNLVGEENKGWTYAKFLLGHERVGIARIGASKYRVQRAKELAARVYVGDKPLAETERFREKVAALEVELKALEITQMRVIANSRNLPPGVQDPASSVLKLKGTELQQAATEILMEIAGANAMAWQSEHLWGTATDEPIGPEWAATIAPDYFYTRAASIYGGSNEIQKNVIAKRILGL